MSNTLQICNKPSVETSGRAQCSNVVKGSRGPQAGRKLCAAQHIEIRCLAPHERAHQISVGNIG